MANVSAVSAKRSPGGNTMDGMAQTPAHAKPKDHLWVLVIIAACALIETFPSWVGIGAVSGFPHFGRMPTDWTLAVTSEAYWGYALYAGIVAVAGPRSRAFALWSAATVFALSLIGQAAYHLMAAAHRATPPQWVVVFVAALPVIVLALIAVLVHLRHLDRAEAGRAEEERQAAARASAEAAAAADERTALRAELEDARAALPPLQADLETARAELARVTAKADQFARKLAAASGAKRTAKSPANKTAGSPRNKVPNSPPEAEVPNDVDTQAEALLILAAEPGISGSDLGLRLGKTKRYGQILKNKLAGSVAGPDAGASS